MSLFKARDWWSTWAGSDEEFDSGCLCVANIDNKSAASGRFGRTLNSNQKFAVFNVCHQFRDNKNCVH